MNFLNETIYRPWGQPINSGCATSASSCGCHPKRRSFIPVQSYLNGPRQGIHSHRGVGDTQQILMSAPMIAGATLGTASALGATWATAAIPIVGPIIAGVTLGLTALFARKGPRQKVATTQIVDKVEPLLRDNLRGYFSGPRTYTSQAQALANFDAGWQFVVDQCGIPEMGNPGQACIRDRQSGACVWKASCSEQMDGVCVNYALDPAGQCWNWFVGYRDPIANDPNVQPDPVLGGSADQLFRGAGGLLGGSGSGTLLLAAGLGIAALALGGKNGGKK